MSVIEKINKLKKEKNAILLAHYYVPDEVQAIADYVGDSFKLSQVAAETDAEQIIFCGVSFMGESAKILNPEKRVFMPDATADCAMAHMALISDLESVKEKYDDLAVVCYINSTAELKCHSDVCVTSSNAVKIVKALPNKNIFFTPDRNLGSYVAQQVPEKNIVLNNGYCPVHEHILVEEVRKQKKEHENAEFVVHPECPKAVLDEAAYIGSTSGIIDYVTKSPKKEFIIGTETGVFYELKQKNPDKTFYQIMTDQTCHDMKLVTLEKVLDVLEHETNEVFLEEEKRLRALLPLERMLEMGK